MIEILGFIYLYYGLLKGYANTFVYEDNFAILKSLTLWLYCISLPNLFAKMAYFLSHSLSLSPSLSLSLSLIGASGFHDVQIRRNKLIENGTLPLSWTSNSRICKCRPWVLPKNHRVFLLFLFVVERRVVLGSSLKLILW